MIENGGNDMALQFIQGLRDPEKQILFMIR